MSIIIFKINIKRFFNKRLLPASIVIAIMFKLLLPAPFSGHVGFYIYLASLAIHTLIIWVILTAAIKQTLESFDLANGEDEI